MAPKRFSLLLGIIALCLPTLAFAQNLESAPGVVRIGRLYAVPHFVLLTGIDSNVFNEHSNPKSDGVFSVQPDVAYEFRLWRAFLSGTSALSYNYFETYERERSTNGRQDLGIYLPLNRLIIKSNYAYASVYQRPGLEFDRRARAISEDLSVVVDARVRAKTTLRVGAFNHQVRFKNGVEARVGVEDGVAVDEAVLLPVAMNRTSQLATLSLRQEMTALTTLTFTGEGTRDVFDYEPTKDAHGFRVMPGLEFNKYALISGDVAMGLRRFLPTSVLIPAYSGLAARGKLTSVLRRNTRLSGQIERDVSFSFEKFFPYYVQTMVTLEATHRFGRHWDAVVSASGQELDYQPIKGLQILLPHYEGAPVTPVPTITRGRLYSVSLGYLFGMGRVGIEARHNERVTGRPDHDYTARQIGVTFTYGF